MKKYPRLRALLDTNVLISSFYNKGICNEVFHRGIDGEFEILLSEQILKEFEKNMSRYLDDIELNRAIKLIHKVTTIIKSNELEATKQIEGLNPIDSAIVFTATRTKVGYLVTGDKAILNLKKLESTKIISPRDFVTLLDSK